MEARLQALKEARIDMQAITFTAPGTLIETPSRSAELSSKVNDHFAEIQQKYPKQFPALATLPLNNPKICASELSRAINQLELKGACIYSNANGIPLSDPQFWPMYEVANDHNMVIFIHPTFPLGVEAMKEYMLMPAVGFLMDTTLATANLLFSGVVERFPNIRWVLGHLGGAVPYLAERFDRCFEAFPECRINLKSHPTNHLKTKFYYDTVNFDVDALNFAVQFAGAEHILAGSDYPHQIGSLEKMVRSINLMDLTTKDRTDILGKNTIRLLGL